MISTQKKSGVAESDNEYAKSDKRPTASDMNTDLGNAYSELEN